MYHGHRNRGRGILEIIDILMNKSVSFLYVSVIEKKFPNYFAPPQS